MSDIQSNCVKLVESIDRILSDLSAYSKDQNCINATDRLTTAKKHVKYAISCLEPIPPEPTHWKCSLDRHKDSGHQCFVDAKSGSHTGGM